MRHSFSSSLLSTRGCGAKQQGLRSRSQTNAPTSKTRNGAMEWTSMVCANFLPREKQLGFFFQAEDGIRDLTVTGVQTCALPIFSNAFADGAMSQGADVVDLGLAST